MEGLEEKDSRIGDAAVPERKLHQAISAARARLAADESTKKRLLR